MDEKAELKLRRQAIRLSLRGLRPRAIFEKLQRSRSWLLKWRRRFARLGWAGLHSESRAPRRQPQRYDQSVKALILRVRRQLQHRKIGLVGARAIQRELRAANLLRKVPSTATIERWLHEAGLTQAPTAARAAAY